MSFSGLKRHNEIKAIDLYIATYAYAPDFKSYSRCLSIGLNHGLTHN